jgi:hypothetical protein
MHCTCIFLVLIRDTTKALEPIGEKKVMLYAFVIYETMIQKGGNEAWLWIAIEPVRSTVIL